jgi:hypothetical protein
LAHAVTPRGDVIVLGPRRRPDATDGFAWEGYALEILRRGAKRTEIVPVEPRDYPGPERPRLVATSTSEIVISGTPEGTNPLSTGTYRDGRWTWEERKSTEEEDLHFQLDHELRGAHPLLVGGVPFSLHRVFRHAGAYWFAGKAGDLDVTFVEGRVHWKSPGSEP